MQYAFGGGYTHVSVERTNTLSTVEDFKEWNIGFDTDISDFGFGATYSANNGGLKADGDRKTMGIGFDYTSGSIKYGASWLNRKVEESATEEIKANRYAN